MGTFIYLYMDMFIDINQNNCKCDINYIFSIFFKESILITDHENWIEVPSQQVSTKKDIWMF